MTKNTKEQINRALTLFKMTLVANGCGLAPDHEGHLFIFNNAELKSTETNLRNVMALSSTSRI